MVKVLAGRAPAKINLFLRVTGQRPNGYHELDSIFLPVSLADLITLEIRDSPDSSPVSSPDSSIDLKCTLPALESVTENLATRAARAFMDEFGLTGQVLINLDKRIPIGAGLGGGSSDAGTVLQMMARLQQIDDSTRLRRIALSLGADVPFFLDPKPARVRGVGELIDPLPAMTPLAIVIATPPIEVATAQIFRALDSANWSGPAPADHIAAIMRGDISQQLLVNDLAQVAIAKFPQIERLRAMLTRLGSRASQMSGSGGSVFGIFDSIAAADKAAAEARRLDPSATIVAATTSGTAGE
ncbi:MAG: 4-(cytidine 5-diphospho)-2-C-methyl-D-erythritol kinase [Candidatus Binatus sp.]|nr:4-(cytidine 5-diphospho)-2-C-methyl-D-erythritol kinase [Candidatus Binatus sp.]